LSLTRVRSARLLLLAAGVLLHELLLALLFLPLLLLLAPVFALLAVVFHLRRRLRIGSAGCAGKRHQRRTQHPRLVAEFHRQPQG
jgi:hypothetical protein